MYRMKAVILAGGLGSRMMPYTRATPKPMLRLGGRPILEHVIEWVGRAGIRSIVLCTSHLHEKIERHFGDGSRLGAEIEYAVTKRPMSTAGQLRAASDLLDSAFVCAYGDSIFDFSLRAMIRHHARTGSAATVATASHVHELPYGVIRTRGGGRVTSWDEKPKTSSLISVGCYILEPDILSLIPRGRPYGMDAAIRRALSRGMPVTSYAIRGTFLDLGDAEAYRIARAGAGGGRRRP